MTDWYLGNVRIFVQKLNDTSVQTIARLQPMGGGTTLHFFGYEDRITKINAYVVGLTDKAQLETWTTVAQSQTLYTPYGNWGDYAVKSASFELTNMICQNLRPDLPEDSPVFSVDLELYIYYGET